MTRFGLSVLSTLVMCTSAAASICDDLSYQRNAIYARAGYCFKTSAQIRNFGNAGCRFDNVNDVPLSGRDRAEVDQIVRQERFEGCR